MNYYCIACRTGGEAKVRAHLNKYFGREFGDLNDVKVFYPQRRMFERRKGKTLVTDHHILPVYIMLRNELDHQEREPEVLKGDRRSSRVLVAFEFANVVRKVSMPVEFVSSDK